jgi:hypothetical protein
MVELSKYKLTYLKKIFSLTIIFVKCKIPSRDAKISFFSSLIGISRGVAGGGWWGRPRSKSPRGSKMNTLIKKNMISCAPQF